MAQAPAVPDAAQQRLQGEQEDEEAKERGRGGGTQAQARAADEEASVGDADGDDEALLAMQLGWFDGHDPVALIEQELVAAVRPGPRGETFLELQATFRPQAESLELGQTNFGFLAVRVAAAKTMQYTRDLVLATELEDRWRSAPQL